MYEKVELIQGILDLERGTKKRVPGLLFEICFMSRLFSQFDSRHHLHSHESGWLYVQSGSGDGARHWFKVCTGQAVISRTARIFIGQLPHGHRYFSIQITHLQLPGQFDGGGLTIKVTEFFPADGTFRETKEALQYQTDIVAAVGRNLKARGRRAVGLPEYVDWFAGLSVDELELLFVNRCLMNFGLNRPGDIDALALDEHMQPVLIEFKRKNPAKGRRTFGGHRVVGAQDLVGAAFEIAGCLVVAKSADEGTEIYERECKARHLDWRRRDCFGLDLIHYRTLQLCYECGVRYHYFIWDWTKERAGRKKWTAIDDLENVLTPGLLRKRDTHVVLLDLKPEHVSGLTRTFGDDSGSYTDGVRVQLTFDFEGKHVTRMAKVPDPVRSDSCYT